MTARIGLLGCGNISDTHARAARAIPDVEVVAYWGRDPAKASAMALRYGGKAYADLDGFLGHRPMDLVLVGTPSGLHADHARAAARRGLHVLVEKPLDVTAARIDALTAECDRAGVKLGVIYQDRAAPDLMWLKQLVAGGGLGRPIVASARVRWYRPPEYYADSRWRGTWGLDGGGAMMNQGIHTVDLLLWLLGDVDRVYATTRTALHDIAVEDTAVACLEFAGGAVGTLEATTAAFPGLPRRVELTGSEGTIVVEQDRVVSVQLRTPLDAPPHGEGATNPSSTSPVVSDMRGHRRVLEDFIAAIRTGATPLCDGRDGRRSVALVEAMYRSARTGAAVVLGEQEGVLDALER
jgi:UDP-N-acetyl-2-amino-2-deoxyglucuronate dehydrogenase